MLDLVSINPSGWSLNGWFALVTLVLWLFVALLCVIFSKE